MASHFYRHIQNAHNMLKMPPLSHRSASSSLYMFTSSASGGKVFTIRDVLLPCLSYHLRLTFIQIKRAVYFLLLYNKLTKPCFMLKGFMKLFPVIRERLFPAFNFGLFLTRNTVKTAQGVFNTGYGAECVLCVQVCFVHVLATQIQPGRSPFKTTMVAHDCKTFVGTQVL